MAARECPGRGSTNSPRTGSVTVARYKKMAERGMPDAHSVFPSPDADTHILGKPMLP